MSDRILIGVIVGAHGVRGEVKIKSFTAAAADVAAYGPVTDEAGTRRLKLKLVGVKSNRAAIGARIKVTVETPSGKRAIHKTVNSGATFGASPLRQEIGLGNANRIDQVEIWWPTSGIRQTVTQLEKNRAYTIREGENTAKEIALKPFKFSKDAHAHHH